jgi:hypothetical protein
MLERSVVASPVKESNGRGVDMQSMFDGERRQQVRLLELRAASA